METYIGMDFGGTKLLVGEVNSHGEILGLKSYTTGYVNQEAAVYGAQNEALLEVVGVIL